MKLQKTDILTLEGFLTLLEKSPGRLTIISWKDTREWLLSFAWSKEAEDSPMYGASIDEVAMSLPEVLEKARTHFKA